MITEDGRNYRPKHVELIVIINKNLLLLHLVGCLIALMFINNYIYYIVIISATHFGLQAAY